MARTSLKQGQRMLDLITQSGIERSQLKELLKSGRFTELLKEFMTHPKPTITPISFTRDYNITLEEARDALGFDDDYIDKKINDKNFPPEKRDGEREFVLVCFHRDIRDHVNPEHSELLRELDRLGLVPEGAMELCFVGADELTRDLQMKFPIVARRQLWRQANESYCPLLREVDDRHALCTHNPWGDDSWFDDDHFLASRK